MDFEPTPEQALVRRTAREFAEGEIAPVIAHYDEAEEFPAEILKKLGALGFMGCLLPPEYGGAGLDYVSYALVVEELCRIDGSVGITMWAHNSLCANHIALFGSKEQRQRYLPRLARGEMLGAWGLTEPGSGSDAAAMAKLFASEAAMKAATRAVQIHGGAGYITEFPVERIFRDAKLTEIGEGTSEIQRLLIARGILESV